MDKLNGIGASSGIAIAKVFEYAAHDVEIKKTSITNSENEIKRYLDGVKKSVEQLKAIQSGMLEKAGADEAAIFDAHIQVATDPAMLDEVKEIINEQNLNAEYATSTVAKKYEDMFAAMDDPYFQERSADIKDVFKRVVANIAGIKMNDLSAIKEEVIIVADDLTPSDTAQLDKKYTKGFLTDIGGRTSHAAIMARSLEIPAVLGLKDITKKVKTGDMIIMDGESGEVIINPSQELINEFKNKLINEENEKQELKQYINKESITKDGHQVYIEANIGSPKDATSALENGAEGIGLFRSEFLYMDSDKWPSEEEQFNAYKSVLEKMQNKLTIIRTLDIGGDKTLSYYKFPAEMNPFLGYRAVRLCLDQKEIFKTQLRALIRASAYGNLGIMIPLIATVQEFLDSKAIYEECLAEIKAEGKKYSDKIQFGMMVEVPSAAILSEQFAQHADFFSIGTNDLIQYSHAADRMSEKVSYLYQPCNPSILNLVKLTIDGAHKNNKWVGMCGEMAGDIKAIPLLLGLGLDYFSMSATSIPKARKIIASINFKDCQKLALECCKLSTQEEVLDKVNQFLAKHV